MRIVAIPIINGEFGIGFGPMPSIFDGDVDGVARGPEPGFPLLHWSNGRADGWPFQFWGVEVCGDGGSNAGSANGNGKGA